MITPQSKGEMSFSPTESPLYGGGQIEITFGSGTPPVDPASDLFLVFEGNNRRHVTSAKRMNYRTYTAIIPGHDAFEDVSLTVCSLLSGGTAAELRPIFGGTFIFMPDSTFYLTQFLISSVWDPESLDNPARIKGENFNLCEEDFTKLDERLTCAFKHIERPASWKVVTDSPRVDQNPPPRETLLHFAARFGLRDFAEYLLDKPGCEVALKLPNKDGDLAVELARTSRLDDLADRMLEQSLNEEVAQRTRRLEHVDGKACTIKRHYKLGTATITTKLDESNNTIEDNIQMLRDVVSYMEADEEDDPRSLMVRNTSKQNRLGHFSPDHDLSPSSCSDDDDDDEDEEDEEIIRPHEYRTTLEPVLEDSIQQIQTINHHVQSLRQENRHRLTEGARRESLSRFSTSCPLLTEDKPELEGWKQKLPSHPGAVTLSDEDDDDDLDDQGRGSSVQSPLSPKTPPIQIQVNDISLDSSGGDGGGGGTVHIIPTIPSHHVVIPLAPIATTPEDSSPEDIEAEGGFLDNEDVQEKTRRYSWGPEPDDSLRSGARSLADGDSKLSAASRSKSLMNLDATGQDNFHNKKDSSRRSNQGSSKARDSHSQNKNEGYRLGDEILPSNNANSSSKSAANAHGSVVRRQKRNLTPEQRQHRSASMFEPRLASDDDQSGDSSSANSLSAEHRRQARLSLTEFLADPRNFADDSTVGITQSHNQMEATRSSVLRKLSFLKVGPKKEKKEKREKDKEKEKEKEEKKEKDREKERNRDPFRQHHFVNSSFSNSTKCHSCEKPLQNKPALQCQICYANVHNSSCKDNVGPCNRLTKHPKSLSKASGIAMKEKLKNTGLGYSQSMREKVRPPTYINPPKPFQPMSFQQGSSPDIRQPLTSAGTIDENDENDGGLGSPPKSGLGNNNISFSVESLDEVGTTDTLEFMDDEDLVTQGPEPESWSVMADKKTSKKMSHKEVKRQDVIFEFIKTEKHHLRTLKIMQKIFSYGMQNELHMDQGLIKKVFPMLDELVDIASKFYDNLQKRQKEAEVVEKIGDILVDQFDGDNGERMKLAYGCLCSQQNEAKAVYKDLTKTDRKFQAFIKKCSTNALCRRWTIPECILSVSSRLTKYQLLIEAIIKPTKSTKADKVDTKDLTKALELVKAICHDVNLQVQERERWQRLMEIYNKTEARSSGTMKSGKKFKKSDLLQNRKLRYEGELLWKSARAKLTEVHGVLLTDVLLLFTESNGKYTFASQDNKPPVIPLYKLMVRDVAIDNKSVYLISPNKAGPEMYEVMCATEHARKEWKRALLQAIEECPDEDQPIGEEAENEEEKKAAEARALRMKKLLEQMHEKDMQLNHVMADKMRLMAELKGLIAKEDTAGSLNTPVIVERDTQMEQTRDIILAAMKEAHFLTNMVYTGGSTGLSRSASSAGERESTNHQSSALPRRAETFSGFDSTQNGTAMKKRLAVIPAHEATTRSSSFPNLMGTAQEQLASFTPPPEGEEVTSPLEVTNPTSDSVSPLPSPSHRPSRELSLPAGQQKRRGSDTNRRRAFTLTGGVDLVAAMSVKGKQDLPEGPIPAEPCIDITESPATPESADAASQIVDYLNSLLKITSHQDTAFQTLKTQLLETQRKVELMNAEKGSSPSPSQKRRNSPPTTRPLPAGQDTKGSSMKGNSNDKNQESTVSNKSKQNGEKPGRTMSMSMSTSLTKLNNNQPSSNENSPRANEQILRSIAYGDNLPSNNYLYLHEDLKSKDIMRKNSAPSPRLISELSSPKLSPKRTEAGERTAVTTLTTTTSSSSIRRHNVPDHLYSTTNQLQGQSHIRQQLPLKLSKSTVGSSATPVQQMLPKKLEALSSSSKPNKNSNAQPQPASDSDVIFF